MTMPWKDPPYRGELNARIDALEKKIDDLDNDIRNDCGINACLGELADAIEATQSRILDVEARVPPKPKTVTITYPDGRYVVMSEEVLGEALGTKDPTK